MLNYRSICEVWKDAKKTLEKPPRGEQLPWWPEFNRLTGGLRPSELTLITAPTGAGKTQLLANISAQLALGGVPQFVAPIETGDSDYVARILSCLAKEDLNNGDPVNPARLAEIEKKHREKILNGPIYISTYDNRVEIEEMVTTLKYMHQQYSVRVAVLDNLNFFLRVTSAQNERIEMDSAIREFIQLAKKIPIHTILIVHPKKTDGGRIESEFDIKGSSTAVQEAYNVILFNRPKMDDVESGLYQYTDREMHFRKVRRRGTAVGKRIWFQFVAGKYEEFSHEHFRSAGEGEQELRSRSGEVLRRPNPRPMAGYARHARERH